MNTLFQELTNHHKKGWIQGSTRIGPVLEITTSHLYDKHGIEIRFWSMRKDNSQSWVRIFHGSNKFVIDPLKPQPRVLVGTTATIPMHERRWIDIEPSEQNLASYGPSIRHTLQREDDGAIEFTNSTLV